MPKPIDRFEQDIQDTLARLPGLKMSERAIEREAGITQGFLAKTRKGKNRHPNAVESLAKLRKLLVAKGLLTKDGDKKEAAAVAIAAVPAAVVLEPDGARTPIGQAILKASTFRRLGALLATIAAAAADGILDLEMAETLEKFIRTRSGILKKEREEQATAKVRALEILTETEVEILAAHRAKLAGPALRAGDYPPPPTESAPAVVSVGGKP